MVRYVVWMALLGLVVGGCDTGGGGGGGGGGAVGHCGASIAAEACDGDCAFDPATIDCAAACANIATVCGGACAVQCQGMESDAILCNAACMGTKGLHCTNLAYGCYATSADCEAVGACVEANADANLGAAGGDDTVEGGGEDTTGGGEDTVEVDPGTCEGPCENHMEGQCLSTEMACRCEYVDNEFGQAELIWVLSNCVEGDYAEMCVNELNGTPLCRPNDDSTSAACECEM